MSRAVGDTAYTWSRQGRNRRTALAVTGVWMLLAAIYLILDASLWLVGLLGLFTLPALFDLALNPSAGLSLDGQVLRWFSGDRHAIVSLAELDHIRLDTRLDFSVRATAVLSSGEQLRLPCESTPPHRAFEAAGLSRGVTIIRHHFSPIS